MKNIAERLKFARTKKGWTQSQLAVAAGVSTGTIGNIESEARQAKGSLPQIAEALGISHKWLARGEGPMEPVNATVAPTAPSAYVSASGGRVPELIDIEGNPDYPAIRRVNIKAQAGVTGYSVEYMEEERLPIFFRRDWYESRGYRPERMIAVRVAGDSMLPSLHDGDLIVVNTERKEPKQGITFLVSHEGEVVVKRLVRDVGIWWLTSDNQDQRRYPRVQCNGDTQIIGEVVYRQTEVI